MAGISSTRGGGLTFVLSMPGFSAVTAGFNRFGDLVSDYRLFWQDEFLPAWTALMTDQFRSEGAATGATWRPLSAGYVAAKRKAGYRGGILVRGGSLSSSLIHPDNSGGLGVWRPTERTLEVGTSRPWALVHQLGSRRVPARPPMRVTAAFGRELAKGLQRFVTSIRSQQRRDQQAYSGA